MTGTVTVAGQEFGGQLFLICGPCVAESEELCIKVANTVKEICTNLGIDYIFKASFDKANRSSIDSERGPGLEKGLEILKAVKEKAGVPVLTDIHLPQQAAPVAQAVDMLQIPAFLCRQTDLLEAAAKTGKPVNVKKGQFMAPWDMENAVGKLRSTGATGIMLTERGSSFGYNSLVTDMRAISQMQKFDCPVVIDATHCVQLPGGRGASSGGQREYVQTIALAAVAAGADGLFLEVHPEPDKAPCDPDSMLELGRLEPLLKKAKAVYEAVREMMESVEMELVKCDLCGANKPKPHVEVEGNTFVKCPECGFIYLNPRPTASQGEVCDASVECLTEKGYRVSRAWYYKRILGEFEPFRKTGRLLEVGCASGGFLTAAKDAGWETVGVEISAKLAGIGQEKGLDIQTCDICDAELADGSFDVAVLNMVIEHVPSPREVAARIYKALRPGGALWMHTPNYASTSIKMARDGYNYPGAHLSCFTPATLKKLCVDTGFTVKYAKTTGFRFPSGRKSWRKPLARFLGFFITLLGKGHRLKVLAVKKAADAI